MTSTSHTWAAPIVAVVGCGKKRVGRHEQQVVYAGNIRNNSRFRKPVLALAVKIVLLSRSFVLMNLLYG
jgi:hypothetical protein